MLFIYVTCVYCHYLRFSAFEILDDSNGVTLATLSEVLPEIKHLTCEKSLETRLQIEAIYNYYAQAQAGEIEMLKAEEALVIPRDVDYNSDYLCLCMEDREKLMAVQPPTVRVLLFYYLAYT